jgi:putative ABC transport system ATP-binding protein
MGESGSGKSTLLSIMGALNTPTSGRFTVEDVDIYALKQDDRSLFRRDYLGIVFQTFHLVPYLSVAQNVMLPLATVKIKVKEKKNLAEEALERVGLARKGHRLPSEISGGEQERVAVARAVVNHPPILLADEPTGNLDTKTSQGIMGLIRGLNDEGMTVVMVTHSPECAQCAGRILRVSDGLLLNGKNPASVCRADGNGKTWAVMKSPPVNGVARIQ